MSISQQEASLWIRVFALPLLQELELRGWLTIVSRGAGKCSCIFWLVRPALLRKHAPACVCVVSTLVGRLNPQVQFVCDRGILGNDE
mgnify:CR=1 FL=1